MKKKILVTGLAAAAVALSGTAFANNWLLYLPAILAGSEGGTEPPPEKTGNNWLLYLPAILAGSQGSEPPPVTGLNDTGIIDCSGVTGSADCAYGRDFTDSDPGDGHAGFSFTKLDSTGKALASSATSWVCVRDNVTGLVWMDKEWITDDKKDWTTAQSDAAGFSACGLEELDWRVPTLKELTSIVSYDAESPSVDGDYFRLPATGPVFWTVNASAVDSGKAWNIDFNFFGLLDYTSSKTATLYVRFVYGTEQTEAFTDNGTTVTDSNTGLTWKKCLEGQSWSGSACTGTVAETDWSGALTAASDAGANWRLPNIKELQSIADYQNSQPAINGTFFPDTPAPTSNVWSNSPYVGASNTLWYMSFNGTDSGTGIGYGEALPLGTETGTYHVRLVCDGDKDACPL
ncbi:MAG: DUF1566 domain-containing protein [Candidatus Electrothrix sp. YB6]